MIQKNSRTRALHLQEVGPEDIIVNNPGLSVTMAILGGAHRGAQAAVACRRDRMQARRLSRQHKTERDSLITLVVL